MSEEPRCAVCQGTKAEHEGRQHAFTLNAGELRTQAEVNKEQQKKNAPQQGVVVVAPPTPRDGLDRLIVVLLDKGILSQDEAMHILIGRRQH